MHLWREVRNAAGAARAALTARSLVYPLAFAASAVAPIVITSEATTIDLASGVYLMIAAVGLNFALGLGDMPSLGQGAFAAIGAFGVALLRTRAGWGVEAATAGAVVIAAVAGALVGAGASRLRTVYVAISTWVVAWLVTFALEAFPGLFGGAQGVVMAPGRFDLAAEGTRVALTPVLNYEIAVVLLALSLGAFARIASSPTGLALAALREGPTTARALGVRAGRLRAGVLMTAAALGAIGGVGIAQTQQVADPAAFGPLLSVQLFVAVLLGGAGTLLGPVVGVAALGLIGPLARALGDVLSVPAGRFEPALSGVLLLAALALGRGGLVTILSRGGRSPARAVPAAGRDATRRGSGVALEARGITKTYGGVRALDAVDLDVEPGAVHAVIGPNGSGKTTLLRVLAGDERADAGTLTVDGRGAPDGTYARLRLGIARTLQRTEVWPGLTVREHVLAGAGVRREYGGAWRNLLLTPNARAETSAADARADEVLAVTGLDAAADQVAARLSGADQRLLMIALAFASEPRLLLLDEPSAGMSRPHMERLAEMLGRLSATGVGMIVVEHNLRLVRYLARRVTVLDAGAVIADGDVAEISESSAVRAAYLGRAKL
ncbi:MAG TPA: ATP-binding cassette domain-containing protein [Actinomycetota bacterium]